MTDPMVRCPVCGLLPYEEAERAGEKPCSPLRCKAWRVVGKSRNGGPLLSIVPNRQEQP